MMKVLYSFNKKGEEAEYWTREIAAASNSDTQFLPFNHDPYLDVGRYLRAQALDDLYYERNKDLLRMYADLEKAIHETGADALVVDNAPPYHPEFLLSLDIYKVLRTSDGPMTAYDRDFAYLHAYDHVLYHTPAYSADLSMPEKLRYCGARRIDFWPMAVFDQGFDASKSESALFAQKRDIDIIFIGAMHLNKMPLIARVKREFRRRCVLHGLSSVKRNVYFNARFGLPGWVTSIPISAYVPLYQRSKIGFNVHNRGDYTVGGYRLFDLPANGVMQISDGGTYLSAFFDVGKEIVGYRDADDLVTKIDFFLTHPDQRVEIAVEGYRRAMRDHLFSNRMRQLGDLIGSGMAVKASQDRTHRVSSSEASKSLTQH
jgi:spore maturation protein CgeB